MFLAVNHKNRFELCLTPNGEDDACLLFIKPKRLYDLEERITFDDLFKI